MSLDAMKNAIGMTLNEIAVGATIDDITMGVMRKLFDQGYEVRERDTLVSPMTQAVIELNVIFEQMQEQGFTRAESMQLLVVVLGSQIGRWTA